MSNDIEREIVNNGLTAPRVTPEHVTSVIADEIFLNPTATLTICVLTLTNGFTVTGESACASPENFNEALGKKIARRNAADKIWALEGYLLKEKLFTGEV